MRRRGEHVPIVRAQRVGAERRRSVTAAACGGVGSMYRLFERSESAPRGAAVSRPPQCGGVGSMYRLSERSESAPRGAACHGAAAWGACTDCSSAASRRREAPHVTVRLSGMEVNGKTAVVTGGASGIGRGHRPVPGRPGMKVVLADIEQPPIDEVVAELAAQGHGGHRRADRRVQARPGRGAGRRRPRSVRRRARALQQRRGRHPEPGRRHLDRGLAVDDRHRPVGTDPRRARVPADHASARARATSTRRRRWPASYAGASMGAYNVAKHGVVALMASLERDLRPAGSPVRASVLCPGPINTNIVDSERNRPADSAAQHVATETGREVLGHPDQVVVRGHEPRRGRPHGARRRRNERFWVLTHPELASWVTKQNQQMVADRSLTR